MRTRPVLLALAMIAALAVAPAASVSAAPKHFANCTAMHHAYKHGVAKKGAHDKVKGKSRPKTGFTVSTALYNANKKMDRDHDGVACEA